MALTISPSPSGFGASISGIDLSAPLSPAGKSALLGAWAAHGVIAFPDQILSLDQQEAFTLSLGDFGVDPYVKAMPGRAHILELRREPGETTPNFGSGWHSDWSFQAAPPAATILHSKVIPPVGGDTLFADCTAAFAALSPAMQQLCEGLNGVHSAKLPYGRDGAYARETGTRTMQIITGEAAEATQLHPLVRVHPVTGQKALYCSPTYTIGLAVGTQCMTSDEGYAILTYLFRHIVEERFLYRHRWSENMLLMWDNRRMLHFAEGGYDGHLRLLHRTTLAGEAPIRGN